MSSDALNLHIMKIVRNIGKAFADAGRKMLTYETPRDAASISYVGLLALFPAVLVLIGLGDAFFSRMNLHWTIVQTVTALFPGSRQFLRNNLSELTNPSTTVILSCMVVVLWASTLIFSFIEGAINRAWGVSHQKSFWESRVRSFSFMILGGASLLISSILTVTVSAMRNRTTASMPTSLQSSFFVSRFWYLILFGTGLLIAILVFTLLFKMTPHCKVRWDEAISGAVVATIMWEVGSLIFVQLVPYFDSQGDKVYGRMGAVIAVLTWVYASSLIMLFGANFSAQLHSRASNKSTPGAGNLPDQDNVSWFPSHYNQR
jgi:membrane protein